MYFIQNIDCLRCAHRAGNPFWGGRRRRSGAPKADTGAERTGCLHNQTGRASLQLSVYFLCVQHMEGFRLVGAVRSCGYQKVLLSADPGEAGEA